MAQQLIKLENEDLLQEGADPLLLWKVVKELYLALNDLTITITPTDAGTVETEEGNFLIKLDVITSGDAQDMGLPMPDQSGDETGGGADTSGADSGGGGGSGEG